MTIQEFYSRTGGNYEEVLRRFGNEARLKKFLGMFMRDENIQALYTSLENKDYKSAFGAAHTLKGVAMNLGLRRLAEADSKLTEVLRRRSADEEIQPLLAQVGQCYGEVMAAISELLEHSPAGGETGAETV